MRTIRPQKRSVSPFGAFAAETAADPILDLREKASTHDDLKHLPALIGKIAAAPANDAPELDGLIQFTLRHRETLTDRGLITPLFEAMQSLFEKKTELFMIDHHDRAHCERMGWTEQYKDVVLFARERDALAGRFFAPFTEAQPGLFSEFVTRWMESANPDRLLHFIDFCSGSKNPTFEHYLLFTHPALARVISNKGHLRGLFEKAQPLLAKLSSPTWEHDVRAALGA